MTTSNTGIFNNDQAEQNIATCCAEVVKELARGYWKNHQDNSAKCTAEVIGKLTIGQLKSAQQSDPAPFPFNGKDNGSDPDVKGYAGDKEIQDGIAELVRFVFSNITRPEDAGIELAFIVGDDLHEAIDHYITGTCTQQDVSIDFRWASSRDGEDHQVIIHVNLHGNANPNL